MVLLTIWSWLRIPVGRPIPMKEKPWDDHGNSRLRAPTWAYLWDNTEVFHGESEEYYLCYTNHQLANPGEGNNLIVLKNSSFPPYILRVDMLILCSSLRWNGSHTELEGMWVRVFGSRRT